LELDGSISRSGDGTSFANDDDDEDDEDDDDDDDDHSDTDVKRCSSVELYTHLHTLTRTLVAKHTGSFECKQHRQAKHHQQQQ
jgi:hypothetical protein